MFTTLLGGKKGRKQGRKGRRKDRKDRREVQPDFLEDITSRDIPFPQPSYKEIQGSFEVALAEAIRRYPTEYAIADEQLAKTRMMERGVLVPKTSERIMIYALGALLGVGVLILAWKS